MSVPSGTTATIILKDGRKLGYDIYGPAISKEQSKARPTIVHCHGFPGSRLEGAIAVPYIAKHGARLIAIDRPGMGLSSPKSHRTFLDFPKDLEELLDHLGLDKVYILGVSGGCPYAVACCKVIPHRLHAAAIVSGIFPFQLGTEGMAFGPWMMISISSFSWLTTPLSWLVDYKMGRIARDIAHPERLEELFMAEMKSAKHEKDVRCLDDPVLRQQCIEAAREAFRQSGYEIAAEAGMYARDWGFRLQDVEFEPIVIWHGALDDAAPIKMVRKAAELLPGATLKVFEDEAHFSVGALHVEEVFEALLGKSDVSGIH
jgi:pimeloyl-ACP methyl ester carboxylesterase